MSASGLRKDMQGPEERDERVFAIGLLAVCALGLLLRALHLDIPMRYDETVTYSVYASHGWEFATSTYDTPNNHVFHTLLVGWATAWLGGVPIIIRLPAFLAGCLLIPITAWVARQAHGRAAGLIAATVVATSPILIEFSTNARGYTLLALSALLAVGIGQRLLARSHWLLWVALVEVGVVGLYTLPIMLLPWAGITVWLAANMLTAEVEPRARTRQVLALALTNGAVMTITSALYVWILSNEGLGALVGNRFVQAQPLADFLAAAPVALWAMVAHWTRGTPWPLGTLAGALIGAAVFLRPRQHRVSLPVALVATSAVVMLIKRNHGEPRIWLWVVPFLAIGVGIGVVELARRRSEGRVVTAAVAASAVWAILLMGQIFVAQPVRASLETGAFPEVEDVVVGMREHFRSGDVVMSDFISAEPLRYYAELYRLGEGTESGPPATVQRSWIVRNRRESARVQRLDERVARLGAPPLEESKPIFTVGMADVYLYGRPAQSADPRLVEALEWYTGVAGSVDDRRAHDLLREVLDDTGSALARMWLARCQARGRMLFERNEPLARGIAAEVFQEVRELAQTGEPEAIFLVGGAYAEGLGVEPDPEEAIRWYRAAAETGHVLAQRNLGEAYAAGAGVEVDAAAAVLWWTLAAEQGDALTQFRLGEAYEAGRGVDRDLGRARDWYTRSAGRGNPDASSALRRLRR